MSKEETKRDEELLRRIVGFRLTAVNFILDYINLSFDSKGNLTTFIWPEIVSQGNVIRFGDCHYRDRLCDCLGKIVIDASVSSAETITIRFDESSLVIPLQSDTSGNERALFTAPQNVLRVWN